MSAGRWVSYMRIATTTPEAAVRAATAQMAASIQTASARMPARRATTANPPSRHQSVDADGAGPPARAGDVADGGQQGGVHQGCAGA
jgi:hypothetical protein